jgi:hypothetical protein
MDKFKKGEQALRSHLTVLGFACYHMDLVLDYIESEDWPPEVIAEIIEQYFEYEKDFLKLQSIYFRLKHSMNAKRDKDIERKKAMEKLDRFKSYKDIQKEKKETTK